METQELCVVPKAIELEYHEEQEMHCFVKLVNKTDQVISFKIKTNHRQLYLVKPMEGSIYNKDSMRILFKRKELTPLQFDAFMSNPNGQNREKFLVEIEAQRTGLMGRATTITQKSYIAVKFVKSKTDTVTIHFEAPQELESPSLRGTIREYKKQFKDVQRQIRSIKDQLSVEPLNLIEFVMLLIIAFLVGFAM